MGGGSKSSTSQTQRTSTTNLNLQDIDGVALVDSAGATVLTTDQGAIDAGRELAREAFDFGDTTVQLNRDIVDLGTDVIEAQRSGFDELVDAQSVGFRELLDTQAGGLDRVLDAQQAGFGDLVDANRAGLDRLASVQTETFERFADELGDLQSDAFDFAQTAQSQAQSGVNELVGEFGAFAESASNQLLSAINTIQGRESTNTDARLESITERAIVVSGLVLGGVILVMVFRN